MSFCRHCQKPLQHRFLDLGVAPPSNAYLSEFEIQQPEIFFPLQVMVCDKCWLVQTKDYAAADALFTRDYAYFSSTSKSWLAHAKRYSEMIIKRQQLNSESFIVEIASNDGYLLRNFVQKSIPCLGIEPTQSTAQAAMTLKIPVIQEFFGEKLGLKLGAEQKADLIIGNNVFAHVPDINDFARGMSALLKTNGIITLEFPHLLQLIQQVQFDTIYHEHFSYLSLHSVQHILALAGLRIFDIETLPTHGGSLRLYICHHHADYHKTPEVDVVLDSEIKCGLLNLSTYVQFQAQAEKLKDDLLFFLLEQKKLGKKVVAYGAAAKGNTLLNFAGIKSDLLPFICDAALSKQGKYMPGSHIPIVSPARLDEFRPDYVFILPWNISDEVINQISASLPETTHFVTAVPELRIL